MGHSLAIIVPNSIGLGPSISGENVVFGSAWREGGNPIIFGIYAWINGSLRVIADTRTKVPQRDGNFFNFNFSDIVSRGSVPAIDNENVAFIASGGLPREYGIYAYFNGSLQVIAETNITTVPGTTATFLNVAGGDGGRMSPSLSGENIAFGGTWREEGGPAVLSGIFAYINGELRTIADRSTKVPGKNATFTNFKADEGTSPTISGENVLFGALAFGEETGGFNGLYAHLDPPVIPAVSGRRIILLVLLIIVAGALILRRSTSELR